MELLLNYTLKSGLCLLVLYLFYYAVLRSQPGFALNRLYLLLSPVAALVLPLVQWPSSLSTDLFVSGSLQHIQLAEVVVTGYADQASAQATAIKKYITLQNVLLFVYLAGVGILLFRFLGQLLNIRKILSSAKPVEFSETGATILQTKPGYPTFAFLKYVFVSEQEHLSSEEKRQVLHHEIAHVQLLHTWDILYYELLTVLLWFNPIMWLLKNELRDVHEFQADAQVLTQHAPNQYSVLLAKEVLYKTGVPVGSYFREPQVFKRLQMLQQHGKQTGWVRPLLLLPLAFVLLTLFSAQQVTADIASTLSTLNEGKTPTAEEAAKALLEAEAAATEAEEQPTTPAPAPGQATEPAPGAVTEEQEPTQRPESLRLSQPTDMPVAKAEAADHMPNAVPVIPVPEPASERPYEYVEQMPTFKGGESEMMKFLGKNIKYPKDSPQGLAVASFVVRTDGTLTDITVLKSLSPGADEETIRVIKQMQGQWLPGMQNGAEVPVRFTLPVRFKLK